VRDALGTVYGSTPGDISTLFTATFFGTLVLAPLYAAAANRIKLSVLLPAVYGFIIATLLVFYALFNKVGNDRWVAFGFYVWVSVFNMLITSVFWSFMADLFSRTQAKRLYGIVAAGGSAGAFAGPAITAIFVKAVGTSTLLVVSAVGFAITIVIVLMLVREKEKLRLSSHDFQKTSLEHTLKANPFAGFTFVAKSPYLLGIAAFVLLMTWVSGVLYFKQQELITAVLPTREDRAQALAILEVIVNSLTIAVQLFGTGRLVARFGVTTGLVINAALMVVGFVAIWISPTIIVLFSAQVARRVSEYAFARPSREMLFSVVDQEAKYKAKNVIDTVVYRGGDVTQGWIQTGLTAIHPTFALLAAFGLTTCALWAWVGMNLGRRYENVAGDKVRLASAAAE
jgi:AAA family ATP:ADP antiporter